MNDQDDYPNSGNPKLNNKTGFGNNVVLAVVIIFVLYLLF